VDVQRLEEVTVMRSEVTVRSAAGRPRLSGAAPRLNVQQWRTLAACGGDATLFYKNDFDSDEQTRHRVTRAKAVCKGCPVRPQCAAYALTAAEPYGIWGGFTESERARLLASGWREYADRRFTRVDVARLQARLRAIRAEERMTATLRPTA
jgi:WhiB family transcriptional regulator, redox-sensing transcriptional regulator